MKTVFPAILSCLLFAGILLSCAVSRNPENEEPLPEEFMETYFVVVVDTTASYDAARAELFRFRDASKLSIDTMDRYFNTEKRQLVLSETNEDEVYRGEYFSRRGASESLSIEYLNSLKADYSGNTFAVVGGIFATQADAKSLAAKWKSQFPKIHVQRSEMYMGCMH